MEAGTVKIGYPYSRSKKEILKKVNNVSAMRSTTHSTKKKLFKVFIDDRMG